jgi:hypothetical protein
MKHVQQEYIIKLCHKNDNCGDKARKETTGKGSVIGQPTLVETTNV